ncbi:MAG: Pycsar system effector family protein [Ilumatobacteraceae bacterium]
MSIDDSRKEAVDHAWKIHEAVLGWTEKVDSKANYVATIETALIVGAVAMQTSGRRFGHLHGMALVLYWVGLGLLILGLVMCVWVVRPRLRTAKVKTESTNNFIYFGHVKHWDPTALENAFYKQDMLAMLSRQLVATSKIAWEKHLMLRWSVHLTAAGVLTLVWCSMAR